MNQILVTGGAGFIGQHLLKKLSKLNCEITLIDNLSNAHKDFQNTDISFHKRDIRNKDSISDIFKGVKVDTCVHLAAKTSVSHSITNPFETFDINIKGTLNVLDACSNSRVDNFVFASSAAAYGEPKKLPILEDHILDPISPYGASKVAGEILVSSYGKFGNIQNAISLRFFNVYGEGETLEYAGVITKFAERLSKGLRPIIHGDGQQTRDFVSVNDVVNAIVLAMKSSSPAHHVFNIASGKSISINDLAKTMIRMSRLDLEPVYKKERKGDIKYTVADTTRAKKTLGFTAKDELEHGLKQLILNLD
ncbi:MAG TPA: NAD-dependent epimerase/dehydratase family protein [Candidatus Bathyarchaeia archaeon]|nr:NAD-dependent epimerase/dehydratase family protein [Candidatus Bathyarchaeia archaeon]